MNKDFLQPAAILAAAMLTRLDSKETLTNEVIADSFLQAYEALQLAQKKNQKLHPASVQALIS